MLNDTLLRDRRSLLVIYPTVSTPNGGKKLGVPFVLFQ